MIEGRACNWILRPVRQLIWFLAVTLGSVLRPLLFIFTSRLLHIVENSVVGCVDDTMTYAVVPRLLLHLQVMALLDQDLTAINCW